MKCGECIFFAAHTSECRKSPPTAFLIAAQGLGGQMEPRIISGWAPTVPTNFCGGFMLDPTLAH